MGENRAMRAALRGAREPAGCSVVLVAVSTLGCPYEPPPDLDDEAGEESSGTGAILDDRVFDGHGMGVIRPARIVDGEDRR
jgi:hypothetical protein